MTLQECYVKIGGDYNDILHRFMNENMVRKFVLKFPQDNNILKNPGLKRTTKPHFVQCIP